MNQGFKEFGKDDRSKRFRQQVAEFKREVDTGATVCTLMTKFPDVCVGDPFTARKHIEKANEKRLSSLPEHVTDIREDEWTKAGCPTGLPWKACQAQKKGKVCKPSHEEWVTRNVALTRSCKGGTAMNVFTEWSEGSVLKPPCPTP